MGKNGDKRRGCLGGQAKTKMAVKMAVLEVMRTGCVPEVL